MAKKETQNITLRFPKSLVSKIDTMATLHDRSRNYIITKILESHFNQQKP